MKGKGFYILTLGCKINQYESEAIREAWIKKGLFEVHDPQKADIVLINSCAVTHMAISDTKKYARRFARQNPECKIIVTGCAIPRWEKEIKAIDGVRLTIPQREKFQLLGFPENIGAKQDDFRDNFSLKIQDYFRARPIIKIQDGCSHYCKYCIVPLTRGPSKSRDVLSILEEVKTILDRGFKEIIISGINLKEFKGDYLGEELDLWDLIEVVATKLVRKYQGARIRISSLDPSLLNDRALDVISKCPEIAPHLHVSVQSASKKILEKMGRSHYSPDDILNFMYKLREIWPIFGLGCDVLVGFPGEDDKDFLDTYNFCKKMSFTYGHVFKYSKRPDTPAAKYPYQVPKDIKQKRSFLLRKLFLEKKKNFLKKLLSLDQVNIIVEDTEKLVGMNEYYIICKINKKSSIPLKKGELIKAVPMSLDFDKLNLVVKQI